MVKVSNSSSIVALEKRNRIELIDLKLFISRPSKFYSPPKVSKKSLTKKTTKISKVVKSAIVAPKKVKSVSQVVKKSIPLALVATPPPPPPIKNNTELNLNNQNYTTSGTASWNGNTAVLTTDSADRIGSVYTNQLIDIEKSFNIEFSFTSEVNGCDGFALILHNSTKNQDKSFEFYNLLEGGLLEYNSNAEGGILGIEFKTILSDDIQQPDFNCITVKSSVESVNSLTHTVHQDRSKLINYSTTNHVKVSYNSNNSSISLVLNNQIVFTVVIPKLVGKSFIGFTAATGFCIQRQTISNCKITVLN